MPSKLSEDNIEAYLAMFERQHMRCQSINGCSR